MGTTTVTYLTPQQVHTLNTISANESRIIWLVFSVVVMVAGLAIYTLGSK